MDLCVHYRSAGETMAEVGPLLLRVLNGATTTHESLDRLVAMLDRLVARWPVVGVLLAVEHGSPMPTPEVRRRFDAELRRYGERIVVGYAFLGLGFWNADVRGLVADRSTALGTTVIAETSVHQLATRIGLELVGVDPELIERSFEKLRSEQASVGS